MNRLTLKWGTIKAWDMKTPEALAALKKWLDGGVSASCMMQKDTPEQRQAILDCLPLMDEIYLDWDDKEVDAEGARAYLLEYWAASK